MKRSQHQNELKARDEKIKLMNDRQKQWMEERRSNEAVLPERPGKSARKANSTQEDISNRALKGKKKNSTLEMKNSNEVFLWTAKNPDAVNDGFVVRRPLGKSDGRVSSRSSKSVSSSLPSSSRARSGRQSHQDAKDHDPSVNRKEHLTSTPGKSDNYVADLQLSKDLSSVKITNSSKDGEKYAVMHDNMHDFNRYQYSSYREDERKFTSDYPNLPLINNVKEPMKNHVNMQRESNTFAMHCCPLCKKLMHSQSHKPFLIIPCGHNVCAQCHPAQTVCPTCSTKISSTVENATLCHVIREYKKQEEKEELARKEEEARKFVEEYDSLKTRYDVLSCKWPYFLPG